VALIFNLTDSTNVKSQTNSATSVLEAKICSIKPHDFVQAKQEARVNFYFKKPD
jgi:hypothetical protein